MLVIVASDSMVLVNYEIEQDFGRYKIIDETSEEREFPLHMFTTGIVKKWKEFITPRDNGKDIKTTCYELELDYENIEQYDKKEVDSKYGESINIRINTDEDQTLSQISTESKKKYVDYKTQDLIMKIFLVISVIMNLFLIIQQTLDPSDRFVLRITASNAGWFLLFFAIIWGIDASQSSKAVEGTLFVQGWTEMFHPAYERDMPIAEVCMLESTQSRVSDNIPIQMEMEHILVHDHRAKKAEEAKRAAERKVMQKNKIIEDLNEDKEQSEMRIKQVRKEYYKKGLIDSDAKVSLMNEPSELVSKYEVPLKYIAVSIVALVIYGVMKSIAENTPENTFVVSITEVPPIAWIMGALVILFTIRWIMNYLGMNR